MDGEVLERVEGNVEGIIFHNDENGYTVAEISCAQELVVVVGEMPRLSVGEEIKLLGKWIEHPSYGRQFKAESVEQALPSSVSSILKYLASGAIKGVGPSTASKIVELFGSESLTIMEKEPARLALVRGISEKKAEEIGAEFRQQFSLRSVMLFLQQYEITPAESVRIWKKWGSKAVEMIRENPYILCEVSRIGFEKADAIAGMMGIDNYAACRIQAGILHVIGHNRNNGHTFIPRDKLIETSLRLLDATNDQVEEALDALLEKGKLIAEEIGGKEADFLPEYYHAENYIATRLHLMLQSFHEGLRNAEALVRNLEEELGIIYAAEQRDAMLEAAGNGVMILTGGPGTGKTTTIKGIIRMLQKMNLKVGLAAPTGRAAKRMSELTNMEAKTIHRLLEMEYDENEIQRFARNEKRPLELDAVIIDEMSMVDIMLFESLLRAMRLGCRLIMVGDADQLPSVGAGNVFRDIENSGKIPVIRLKYIFRQAAESLIVVNAHKIVSGEIPILDRKDSDFFFLPCKTEEQTIRVVNDLVGRRLPNTYGYSSLWDMQVIAPSRKGICGTVNLNARLQDTLNPASVAKVEMTLNGTLFREGDKVMQVKNNYDIIWNRQGEEGTGIYNGDIGVVQKIKRQESVMEIRFDDRVCEYGFELAEELDLAYAITTHKSQGSEFNAVILPLFLSIPQLLYRNLFYTAVTRAKQMVILVGSQATIAKMVQTSKKVARYTALKDFLQRDAN